MALRDVVTQSAVARGCVGRGAHVFFFFFTLRAFGPRRIVALSREARRFDAGTLGLKWGRIDANAALISSGDSVSAAVDAWVPVV
jgi:hypothetical protein